MSLQTINIGSLPNDGTGDPLRSAYAKVNANFSTLLSTVSINTLDNTPNQVLYSVPLLTFTQSTIQVVSRDASTSDLKNVTLSVVKSNDGTNILFTSYGEILSGASLATYNIDVSAGNVRLLCSPAVNIALAHTVTVRAS